MAEQWTSHDTNDGDWVVDMPHDPACTVQRLWFGDMENNTGADIDRANFVATACNAFDELVAALKQIANADVDDLAQAVYVARQAIAKTRGES